MFSRPLNSLDNRFHLSEKYDSLRAFNAYFYRSYFHQDIESHPLHSSRQSHYKIMIEHNLNDLRKVFDPEFIAKIINGNITESESTFAIERIVRFIMQTNYQDFPNIAEIAESNNTDSMNYWNDINVSRITNGKSEIVSEILKHDVALLLVRPQVFYMHDLIQDLLESNGYQIEFETNKSISFNQFWGMYNQRLASPKTYKHSRSAIFNYVNRPSKLFILSAPNRKKTSTPLSDALVDIKGQAGVYKPGTIRGDLIFKESLISFMGTNARDARLALDPIMSIHYLINDPNTKFSSDVLPPYFRYNNLRGIHTPESHEIHRDLAILLSKEELEKLSQILQNRYGN